jgi:hypothetical protein
MLTEQPKFNPNGAVQYQTIQLSIRFGIPEPHAREILIELAGEKFISLSAWDGDRERAIDKWPDLDIFFNSPWDGGHVRVRGARNACGVS